jgi:hypothetical protein
MATTPHADPPKNHTHDPKAGPAKAPDAKAAPEKHYETLTPENAYSLFYNGHRIAKQGDPPEKWISMSRTADGTPAVMTPMTPEMEATIKGGEYYFAEGPPTAAAAPAGPPTNVDVPYVSAMGAAANCTMGNWKNEPTSYAYAWQRDGIAISGATSADYTMVAADKGKAIRCIVTATNAAGSTAAPPSNPVVGP